MNIFGGNHFSQNSAAPTGLLASVPHTACGHHPTRSPCPRDQNRPEPTTAPIWSMSEGAWYDRPIAQKVTPNPTPKILEEQTLFKQRQMKCPVRRLTETRARLHLLTLERKPDRGAAVRMYQAINPAWPSAGLHSGFSDVCT